jgi:hypothetical protein
MKSREMGLIKKRVRSGSVIKARPEICFCYGAQDDKRVSFQKPFSMTPRKKCTRAKDGRALKRHARQDELDIMLEKAKTKGAK